MHRLIPIAIVACGLGLQDPAAQLDALALDACVAQHTRELITDLEIDRQVRACAAAVGFQGDLEEFLP